MTWPGGTLARMPKGEGKGPQDEGFGSSLSENPIANHRVYRSGVLPLAEGGISFSESILNGKEEILP